MGELVIPASIGDERIVDAFPTHSNAAGVVGAGVDGGGRLGGASPFKTARNLSASES